MEDTEKALGRVSATATLFPFVCGICYEKFNKIDVYYLHLQAHNQNTSDCFHICYEKRNKAIHGIPEAGRNIFQCGSCSKTFFSICTLHKHMQDIYDQGSYEFDHSINTAFPKGSLGNTCLTNSSNDDLPKTEFENNTTNGQNGVDDEVPNNLEQNPIAKGGLTESETTDNNKTERKGKDEIKKPQGSDLLVKHYADYFDAIEKNWKTDCDPKGTRKIRRGRPRKNSDSNENSSNVPKAKSTKRSTRKNDSVDIQSDHGKPSKSKKGTKVKVQDKKKEQKNTGNKTSKSECEKTDALETHLEIVIDRDEQIYDPVEPDTRHVTEIGDQKALDTSDKVVVVDVEKKCKKPKPEQKDPSSKSNADSSITKVSSKRKRNKRTANENNDGIVENKRVKKYFYTCNICNKTMGLSHKKRHHAIHAAEMEGEPKPQEFETCDMCGKTVVKAGLKLHQSLHSDVRRYLCDQCPKAFKLKSNLHHHKKIHQDFKPHACEVCGKRFHRRTDLRFHLRVHSDERPVQCPECPLRFRKTSTLNIHMKVHRGDKCFQCELCGKAFIRKDYLKRHMIWHYGHATHECQICNKKFMEKGGLQRHEKIHSDERAHICHVCGKSFVLSSNLKQHVKKLHNNDGEKKKSVPHQTPKADNTVKTGGHADSAIPNIPEIQQHFKDTTTEEVAKPESKPEYHTLLPRIREFEAPVFPPVAQSRGFVVPQEFVPTQPPFYSTAPVGIVQLQYSDTAMMGHVGLPVRPGSEMNSDVTRQVYSEQQQAVQSLNMQYTAIADENMQHYTNI